MRQLQETFILTHTVQSAVLQETRLAATVADGAQSPPQAKHLWSNVVSPPSTPPLKGLYGGTVCGTVVSRPPGRGSKEGLRNQSCPGWTSSHEPKRAPAMSVELELIRLVRLQLTTWCIDTQLSPLGPARALKKRPRCKFKSLK